MPRMYRNMGDTRASPKGEFPEVERPAERPES
jgi:hypothetical protein